MSDAVHAVVIDSLGIPIDMGRKVRLATELSPEEKWQAFSEVTTQEITQADAARKWRVDVSTIIGLRRVLKDAAMAAFAASKPGRQSARDSRPWCSTRLDAHPRGRRVASPCSRLAH